MTVRVVAVADQHGLLPPVPACDVLLVAGDLCPLADHSSKAQRAFLEGPFNDWLEAAPAGEIVGIAGNHDLLAARDHELLPGLPWTYLLDSRTTAGGLAIWGTPWCPTYGDWAFMESEELLERRYAAIPDGLDVLLTHGPPLGACDRALRGIDAGSAALRDAILRAQPAVCVFGHIHEGRGRAAIGDTQCLNVSLVDARYEPRHEPVTIDLERRSPERA
jgi:predicted phosphohydrolase